MTDDECPCADCQRKDAAVIYIQFTANGAIRKMSLKPFDNGVKYVPAFHPSWDNPDGPSAATAAIRTLLREIEK